ncbi:MAG: aminotransferase class III-fold pyridoxal phosphate-dependent enzyme, partial [Candidatus Latescibacteria bacterium]|nr:aminotransferase class III-fold pyridoxal phosphate-dependent enzyme [Candidatus Latescibacterota bacterium]
MRKNTGGIHLVLGVNPDVAVFSKAISNGFPMGAILGTPDVMQAVQMTFISSTCWTERIGPTAALATIRKYRRLHVGPRLTHQGLCIQAGWREAADAVGLKVHIGSPDLPALSHITFDYPNGRAVKTLLCQEMLDRGFLDNGGYYATYAHTDEIIEPYLATACEVFQVLAEAIEKDQVERRLRGPVGHSGFARLT